MLIETAAPHSCWLRRLTVVVTGLLVWCATADAARAACGEHVWIRGNSGGVGHGVTVSHIDGVGQRPVPARCQGLFCSQPQFPPTTPAEVSDSLRDPWMEVATLWKPAWAPGRAWPDPPRTVECDGYPAGIFEPPRGPTASV